jgi:choline-glycine betaine transporter
MRYTLGWFIIGLLSLFYPILLLASEWVSELLDIQPPVILIGLPFIVLLLVCIQLSISVSGLIEQVRVLLEEVAFLKEAKTQDPKSDNELDQSEH